MCPQRQTGQLLSSSVCQRPLKAARRDDPSTQTLSDLAFGLKVRIWKKKKKKNLFGGIRNVPGFFHALHAGHPPALPFFGFGTTSAALPTCPIIHRVNKNGFGWNRRPVSCLKPTGRIVHNTDSLMYILIFHGSRCLCCDTNLQPKVFDLKLDLAKQRQMLSSEDQRCRMNH